MTVKQFEILSKFVELAVKSENRGDLEDLRKEGIMTFTDPSEMQVLMDQSF